MRTLALLLAPLLLAACNIDTAAYDEIENAEPESACVKAFSKAADVPAGQDTHADLWPAFDACESLTEFTEAAEAHPDVIDADPETYARAQCEHEPEVSGSALCRSL